MEINWQAFLVAETSFVCYSSSPTRHVESNIEYCCDKVLVTNLLQRNNSILLVLFGPWGKMKTMKFYCAFTKYAHPHSRISSSYQVQDPFIVDINNIFVIRRLPLYLMHWTNTKYSKILLLKHEACLGTFISTFFRKVLNNEYMDSYIDKDRSVPWTSSIRFQSFFLCSHWSNWSRKLTLFLKGLLIKPHQYFKRHTNYI